MVSNDILLERLSRMFFALRRGACLSFDAGDSKTEFTVTMLRGAEAPQLAIRCHILKRDGSFFQGVWDGCSWTIDNFYAEAAFLTESDIAQLPPADEARKDAVVAAMVTLNSLRPTTICGHRLILRPRQNPRDDLPVLEIAMVSIDGETAALRENIDWADDYAHTQPSS